MNAQPVRCGSVVARRYRATRKIAAGAMGEVWEGVHVELGHRVAIKILQPSALECREILVRFAREAFLLARVDSEHVVRAIDFAPRGRHGPALVMELVEGPTFADLVRDESCSIETAIDVSIDVLRGLRAMHARGVIHRDVKPGNVIIQRLHDDTKRAVLIDLGVARMQSHADDAEKVVGAEITTADRVVGTLEYMAPEQIASCQTAGPQVDVYAVGAMIYRAIAGSHPFGDKRGVDLLREKVRKPMPRLRTGRRDAAARKLEAIVARAVAFSPRQRYENADAMLADLEALRRAMQTHTEDARRWSLPKLRHRKTLLAVAAACATAIAVWSTGIVRRSPPAHEIGATLVAAPPR